MQKTIKKLISLSKQILDYYEPITKRTWVYYGYLQVYYADNSGARVFQTEGDYFKYTEYLNSVEIKECCLSRKALTEIYTKIEIEFKAQKEEIGLNYEIGIAKEKAERKELLLKQLAELEGGSNA